VDPDTQRQHSRIGLRYETDLTDAEWALIEPLMPSLHPHGRRRTCLRDIVNAMFDVFRGGIAGRLLPRDLLPNGTLVPVGL
jgi:transposase